MRKEGDHFSDKLMVTNILNGNIQGFVLVVKHTEKLVTQIVRKMVSNEEAQKDLVQEIYLKAYQKLPSFQFKSKLSTWVASIAYHTTINHLQKKKIPIIELETPMENQFVETETPELTAIKTETLAMLHTAIEQLPPLYKTLIILYHLEALPNKEIAAITNLPEGTIKSYLHRARKILKDKINQQAKNK